jgi:hypothetical protein
MERVSLFEGLMEVDSPEVLRAERLDLITKQKGKGG